MLNKYIFDAEILVKGYCQDDSGMELSVVDCQKELSCLSCIEYVSQNDVLRDCAEALVDTICFFKQNYKS